MSPPTTLTTLANKVVLLVTVFAGFYVSITSVLMVIAELTSIRGSDLPLIILGLVTLVTVACMAIMAHVLSKKGRAGWHVLATIAPVLAGFGALAVQISPYGVLLIAAFAPCLYILVHPARIDGWTRSILDIDDGARITSVLGASGAVLLVITDKIAFSPCPYTFLGLAIALLLAGIYMMARGFAPCGKVTAMAAAPPLALVPRNIRDVAPAVAVSAYLSTISWATFPVIAVFATKQLAVMSSFGLGIPPVAVGMLSIIAFTSGAAVIAALWLLVKNQATLRLAALVCIATLGVCIILLTLAAGALDGASIVTIRLLSLAAIPGTFLAMLGVPVIDVQGIAFHFWKVFLMILGMVLLIVGIGVKINNADMIFMAIYLVVLGVAAVPLVMNQATREAVEVHSP